jgi:hypothetical protein
VNRAYGAALVEDAASRFARSSANIAGPSRMVEVQVGEAQSSHRSSATRENSEALAMTAVAAYRSAWPAISRS